MKFLDLFNEIQKGNFALTDEAIYASIQNKDELIPLYGGNKEHTFTDRRVSISAKTKKCIPITIFSGEGIIISLDGSAGSMTYKNGEKFALNHHAGFITIKDSAKDKVSLEYFAVFFQNFYRSLSVSDGSKTLSLNQIYSEEIELPPYNIQLNIIGSIRKPLQRLKILIDLKRQYLDLLEKEIAFEYKAYQAHNIPICECIDYISGSSSFTEEKNYLRLCDEGIGYKLLTGATNQKNEIVVLNRELNKSIFVDNFGLLVTRKGKAGYTTFLKPGKYALNDDAYILYQKSDSKYEIDLKWLSIQYRTTFLEYASSSDNGTWNMTGFFKHTIIDIPHMSEQKRVVMLFERLEQRIDSIEALEYKFNGVLSKEIALGDLLAL